ncbi:MAG: gliding motility protein GldN [Bacteroidales bacterium]|nr:gliding motility protein GldN [Bacteroidales bacterium]
MKKLGIVLIVVLGFFTQGHAQDVLDGIYLKEHVPVRKPVPYYYLREADVAWSKTIWRLLDLKEKVNHPLYYPTKPTDDRLSLVQLLLAGMKDDGISVYEFDEYNEFGNIRTQEEVMEDLGAGKDSLEEEDPLTGEFVWKYTDKDPRPDEVTRMLMKEVWFFDKQRAKMEVRITGLCPVRRYVKETNAEGMDADEKSMSMKTLFWAYFPAYRNRFATQEVFNPYNDSERRSFDDIFFKRRFASHIYRFTNVYDNRQILEYQKGEDALLEAEKIQDFMFKLEHDLWEL